jgi:hypothetical protein
LLKYINRTCSPYSQKVAVHSQLESIRACVAALRSAILHCYGNTRPAHASLYALTGLEHAAVNAPQNSGWRRKREIELREALVLLSASSSNTGSPHDLIEGYWDIISAIRV